MNRHRRLTKAKDFAAIRRNGRSSSDRLLVLRVRLNEGGTTRVGFSVSKRIGNAVLRNRIKRRLREIVSLMSVEEGWDLLLIARKDAHSTEFQGLSCSVFKLFKRAGVLVDPR